MKQTYEFLKQATINSMVMCCINKMDDTYFGQAQGFVSAANLIAIRHDKDNDMELLSISDLEQIANELKR